MWTLVLVFGMGLAIDPVRLGLTVVMMSRRKPIVNLLAFWLGGILAGVGIGIVVLLLLRETALGAIRTAGSMITEFRSATVIFEGARLQIIIGFLMLVMVTVVEVRARAALTAPVVSGNGSTLVEERPSRNVFVRLGTVAENIMNSDRVWPAFAIGFSSFPPYEGVVVLAMIMASGTAVATQFGALMLFFLVLLAGVEIPLIAYLVKPAKTLEMMFKMQNWLRTYRRQISQVLIGVTGVVLLGGGVASFF